MKFNCVVPPAHRNFIFQGCLFRPPLAALGHPWPPRHLYILYIARIPSVLAFSGSRRKLAHTRRSLRQRLVLSASCCAPRHRLRGRSLRYGTYLVDGQHPLRRSRAPKKQTGSDREHCLSAIKCGASRELSHGIPFSHACPLLRRRAQNLLLEKPLSTPPSPAKKMG